MASLIRVADGAYPQDSYAFLPTDMHVWAGYLGGHTPHPWTVTEINAARANGLTWWGIWTAPDRRAITAMDGTADGAGTVARLTQINYPTSDPVFYDVEYATWHADPTGARAAISMWKHALAAAGWHHAYAYVPLSAGFDWIAHWTGARPASLPAGVVGIQYDHALANDRYDISVFDPSLLNTTGGTDMPITDADAQTLFNAGVANPASGNVQPFAQRLSETEKAAKDAAAGVSGVVNALAEILTTLGEIKTELAAATPPVQGTFTISGSGTVGGP